jgi:hypothetical protein
VLIYLCYSRRDAEQASQLRADLEQLGHEVWVDDILQGGQTWWDGVLGRIRECDLFVLALSPSCAASQACMTEAAYAAALERPILPVVVGPIDFAMLPSSLAALQVVSYVNRGRDDALRLAAAVDYFGRPPALPSPLPDPPPVPVSYLVDLRLEVERPELSFDEQVALVSRLKLELGTDRDGARALLLRLRNRADITWALAKEIDAVLAAQTAPEAPPVTSPLPGPPEPKRIFLCYRREDTKYIVGRLRDSLSSALGRENIFFDVDSLPLGLDYKDEISRRMRNMDLFIILMGPRWRLDRLAEADDQVRLEIEAGLATGQPVVPVMLEDTTMPSAAELPESMASFHFRSGRVIRSDPYYDQDVITLMRDLGLAPRATAT